MKRNFLLTFFILALFISPSFGQWNAKIMLHNGTTGAIDTLWVGCDINGGWGYQEGLDEIDTTWKPFSIWTDDSLINSVDCFNLKKDVKGFVSGYTHFTMQLIDTNYIYPNPEYLKFDTNDFKFDNGDYKITYAFITVINGGYLDFIDNTESFIFESWQGNNYFDDSISLIMEPNLGDCINSYTQMRLQLWVGFNYYLTTTEPFNDSKFRLNPNPASTSIQIHLPSNQQTTLAIFNLLGEKVREEKIIGKEITIDVSDLPAGMYLARTEKSAIAKFVKE